MGAVSVTHRPRPSTVDDAVSMLDPRMRAVARSSVDTDEVAAYLEADGVNDRVAAREYGADSVFALAARIRAAQVRAGGGAPAPVAPPAATVSSLGATVVRAALYLTPAVVAVGGSGRFDGLPAPAGPGALIFGWAVAQALAFLGYRALGVSGAARAARLLAAGFAVAVLGWAGVMAAFGVTDARSHAVAAGQLALFAATSVALVTGTERRVLAAALSGWAASCGLAAGYPACGWLVGCAIVAMLVVAFAPAAGAAPSFRLGVAEGGRALAHGAVGAGQAVLFASVVFACGDPARVPAAAVPLLVGVPLTELVLVWHQRRVAATRAALTDRWAYRGRLTSVAAATLAVLAVPVVAGAALAALGTGRLAAATLLAAGYGLCLFLVAHRRLGLAALLVWWPAVLIGALYRSLPGADPTLVDTLVAVVLFAVCVPALGVVAMVLRDTWSYR